MTKPADSKHAIPSPEDRVRAMTAEELLQKIEAAAWVAGSHDEFDYGATDLRAELLSRLSLVGVMREALRKIGDPAEKVDSLMEARMIARAALTPEPASQAAEEKK